MKISQNFVAFSEYINFTFDKLKKLSVRLSAVNSHAYWITYIFKQLDQIMSQPKKFCLTLDFQFKRHLQTYNQELL